MYPESREPYSQVYASILEGIQLSSPYEVRHFIVGPSSSPDSVQRWLDEQGVDALVVLGNQSLDLLPKQDSLPVVVGGAIMDPRLITRPGVSLNPSPQLLFAGLLKLKPAVKDIHVVYEAEYNEWVIAEAARAAASLNLNLHEHPVSGMREAAAKYREVQSKMNNKKEALWLPLGGPSREKSLLQSILETAWKQDQIVISSNLADVRRGALYALYPDNQGMGAELAKLLLTLNDPDRPQGPLFLSSVFQAVNLRTAEHLGMRLTKENLREFEFVYPPQ